MKFGPKITIKGNEYRYVDTQRSGLTAIYKDKSMYLRIGDPTKISKDLAFHKEMEKYGFPVAKLIDEGSAEGMSFFIEESLGEKCFGEIFKEEVKKFGKIQDKTFDQFIEICTKFAEAQLKTATQEKKWKEFEEGVHIDEIIKELPNEKEKIIKKWQKVKNNLSALPFVISHGDFTPFNIYPKGVIDFEDSFYSTAGYDLGAIIEHLNWFPKSTNYEYYSLYDFTTKQKHKFCRIIDSVYIKHNLPKVSDFIDDYNFAKGIWFAIRMQKTPMLQKYRYDELIKLLN